MLEEYFKLPAVLRRHRCGLLGPHLDSFVSLSKSLGYPRETVRHQCCVIRAFGQWLEGQGFDAGDLDEALVNAYLENLRRGSKGGCGDESSTIHRFVDHLRDLGVAVSSEPIPTVSPLESLLQCYTKYLLEERAVVQSTVDTYISFVRCFLEQRFGSGPLCIRELRESDITDFVLRWTRSQSPKRTKLLVTALRSLFRFLMQRGDIELNLAAAVPKVADWRLATLPKYISLEEVERLLGAFDLNTALGRRDYAIVLLLARLGLRACEVVRLELDDLDWRVGEIVVQGKGFRDRMPMPFDVGDSLATYLRHGRPTCQTRRLFVRARAPHRGFSSSAAISTIVSRALDRVGLRPPLRGAYLLRHSLATGMLRGGASMAEIGQLLRHRSPSTTEIYAKVDFDALRRLARPWPIVEGNDE